VVFKIKKKTQLKKMMDAYCQRQGLQAQAVKFLFDGARITPEDTPAGVSVAE
jgi:small ubiquitin-related modifier